MVIGRVTAVVVPSGPAITSVLAVPATAAPAGGVGDSAGLLVKGPYRVDVTVTVEPGARSETTRVSVSSDPAVAT